MTISELDAVGHGGRVMYRGMVVTFECLTMRFVPSALGDPNRRKQPMKASIKHWDGRSIIVHLKSLSPIPATSVGVVINRYASGDAVVTHELRRSLT